MLGLSMNQRPSRRSGCTEPCGMVFIKSKKEIRGTGGPRRAGNGIRTRDPQLGKLMLYQLSYSRIRTKLNQFLAKVKASSCFLWRDPYLNQSFVERSTWIFVPWAKPERGICV